MKRPAWRAAGAAAIVGTVLVVAPIAAHAHETVQRGDLEIVVGFGTEPAYLGQPNSVQVVLTHGGEPVVDLGDTLAVEVGYGDEQPVELALEPNFAVGAYGDPGDYRAWLIPTAAGPYTIHLSGTVDGEEVDETITSGPDTFSEVESGSEIMYPVEAPATTDLVERIERESARVADAAERIDAAETRAAQATDDASSARTIALVGVAIGLLGVASAGTAALVGRRRLRTVR
jgi:hypothetical protein